MRYTVFHPPKQLVPAWHGAAFGFINRNLASRAVLGEEPVSCGTTQSNQVKIGFIQSRRAQPTRAYLVRHGTKRHETARHGTERHETAQNGTKRHGTARNGTKRHGTARNGTKRHGMSRYGMAGLDV